MQLPLHRFALAAGENALKQVGITDLVKKLIGRNDTGGVRWDQRSIEPRICTRLPGFRRRSPNTSMFKARLASKSGQATTSVSVIRCSRPARFVCTRSRSSRRSFRSGTASYTRGSAAITPTRSSTRRLFSRIFGQVCRCISYYSHDVIEHVDPVSVFRHAFELLAPGGDFLQLRRLHRPRCLPQPRAADSDFLTCPDLLWPVLFSAMETTNRVRWSELLATARQTGFEIVRAHTLHRVLPGYIASIRPHLLPRYQSLSDEDLSVTHCELHLRKPRGH